jgi:hypothetical protein
MLTKVLDKKDALTVWHFTESDGTLIRKGKHHGRRVRVKPGLVLRVKPPLVMCERGLHGSVRALDALDYANTEERLGVSRCRVWGTVIVRYEKVVAEYREVVKFADCDKVVHEFACTCAGDALALIANPDPRSIEAVRVKREWLAGRATDAELAVAGAAAWAAAGAAAWAAAGDAARAVAGAAAWAAAWAAARAVAWAAAGDAARAAAWDAQNERLEKMLNDLLDGDK